MTKRIKSKKHQYRGRFARITLSEDGDVGVRRDFPPSPVFSDDGDKFAFPLLGNGSFVRAWRGSRIVRYECDLVSLVAAGPVGKLRGRDGIIGVLFTTNGGFTALL